MQIPMQTQRNTIIPTISWILKAIMLLLAAYCIYIGDLIWAFASIICFILAASPSIIKRKLKVNLPLIFDLLLTLALLVHITGSLFEIYDKWGYFSYITHYISSIVVAIFGLILVVLLDRYVESIRMNPYMAVFFSLIFTLAMGALWEIFEFMLDSIFKTTFQPSLADTMGDLIFDFFGGLCVAAYSLSYFLHPRPSKNRTKI